MVKINLAGRNLALVIFLAILLGGSLTETCAAQTNWVSLISVSDKTSNTPVPVGQSLLAGHSYNVTIQVDVPFTQAGSGFTLKLNDAMTISGTQYWYLLTKNYGGYDSNTFTPGERSITFKQTSGKINLAVLFSVPIDITVQQALGVTYRFLKPDFQLILVTVTGGSTVGFQKFNISDSSIENYLKTAEQKSNLISAGQVDKAYSALISGVMAQADVVYKLGLPEKATDILNVLSVTNLPAPPNNSMQTILMGAAGLFAVVAIAMFLMYSRVNSKASMRSSTINDARNELAGLEVTAARYDESLANELKRLKEKLGEEA